MSTAKTGVYVLYVQNSILEKLYEHKSILISDLVNDLIDPEELDWQDYPFANLVLKSESPKASAIVQVGPDCESAWLLPDYTKKAVYGLNAKNKEQNMLLSALMNNDIPCVTVEGKAGSGKTICALAAALELLRQKDNPFEKIILSRPMSAVGSSMGALPGNVNEKFIPYAGNYFSNFEFLLSKRGLGYLEVMVEQGKIEFAPLKLIGGTSWHNAIVLADEVQSLTPEQFYALTTRTAEDSKLILMGDSAQRYGKAKNVRETGLYQWCDNDLVHTSDLVFYIKLIKQERSELADLAYRVFIDEDG